MASLRSSAGAPPAGHNLGRRLVANTAANFAGQAVLLALAFLATPYIISRFGASRYGVLVLVLSFVNVLALFQLGFNSGLVKYLAAAIGKRDPADAEAYLRTGLALYLTIGLTIASALGLGAHWAVARFFHVPAFLRRQATTGLYLAAVAFALRFVAEVFNAVPIAAERFDIVNWLFVGSEVVRIAGSVAVVYLGFLVEAVLGVVVFANLLFLVATVLAAQSLLPGLRLRPAVSAKHLRDLLHFSKFAAVSQAASRLGNGLDGMVIAHLMPVAFVAFYLVPAALCFKIWTLVGNVTSVTFPAASSPAIADHAARLRELYLRGSKMVFALAGVSALALCFLSRQVLANWIDSSFAREGATTLALLSLAVFLNCLMHIPDAISNGLGRPWIPAGFNVTECLLKFALFFALIPPLGVTGAAAGYLLTQLLLAPWFVGTANKIAGVTWRQLFLRSYFPALPPLAGSAIVLALWRPRIESIGTLLLALGCAGAAFLALGLFLILDRKERAACFALTRRAVPRTWVPDPSGGAQ